MTFLRYTLATILTLSPGFLPSGAAQESAPVRLLILRGQNAVNVLAPVSAVSPIVEVHDKNDRPVAGAHVTFALPKDGPRALFAGGKNSISVRTGSNGRAKAAEMRPLGAGKFEIAIRADYRGQAATSTITQINVETAAGVSAARAQFGIPAVAELKILVLSGDDGVNIIDTRTAVKSVVKIVDKNDLPVAGVAVTVAVVMTRGGAKADLSNNKDSTTVTTNSAGIAYLAEMEPTVKGSFRIQIQANAGGQLVTRTITQTNYQSELIALNAGKIPGSSKGDAPEAGEPRNGPIAVRVVDDVDNATTNPRFVEVRDAGGFPVSGVKIAFLLSRTGPGNLFPNGQTYLITSTNAEGRAEIAPLPPTDKRSSRIKVLAYYQGSSTSTTIQYTNALAVKGSKLPHRGMASSLKILLLVGGVAAAGAAVAVSQSKGNPTAGAAAGGGPVRIGISIGAPSVGVP